MKNRYFIYLLGLLSILLLYGCPPKIDYVTEWTEENGWQQFYTNDPANYGERFVYTVPGTDGAFPIEIEAKKNSGGSRVYGVVFCYQNDGSYYRIQILNGDQLYNVYAIDSSGVANAIATWTVNTDILEGLNQVNVITITETGNNISISFNGSAPYIFDRSIQTINLSDGLSGYYAYTGLQEYEDLPDVPVICQYKMSEPVVNP